MLCAQRRLTHDTSPCEMQLSLISATLDSLSLEIAECLQLVVLLAAEAIGRGRLSNRGHGNISATRIVAAGCASNETLSVEPKA